MDELELTAVLHALSDETRLRIVDQLAREEEVACGHFAVDIPNSSLSHHLRVLITAGVIGRRRQGTNILNRLRMAELDQRFPDLLGSVLRAYRAAVGR